MTHLWLCSAEADWTRITTAAQQSRFKGKTSAGKHILLPTAACGANKIRQAGTQRSCDETHILPKGLTVWYSRSIPWPTSCSTRISGEVMIHSTIQASHMKRSLCKVCKYDIKYEIIYQIGVELDGLHEYTWLRVHVPSSQEVLGVLSPELPCWEGAGMDGLGICSGTRRGRTQMPWHWSRLQSRRNRKVCLWRRWAPEKAARRHFFWLG